MEKVKGALAQIALGDSFSRARRFKAAELCFRKAIELNDSLPMAHNNLGWVRQAQGDSEGAIVSYQRALKLNPLLDISRRNLAALLSEIGRFPEAIQLWAEIATSNPSDEGSFDEVIDVCLRAGAVASAAKYAWDLAILRRSSRWYKAPDATSTRLANPIPQRFLTAGALQHDIEQFRYLRKHQILGGKLDGVIRAYERILATIYSHGDQGIRIPLKGAQKKIIGATYNRIVHIRRTPTLHGTALSRRWKSQDAEAKYLDHPKGLVVVDNFLSEKALKSLHLFCLQSTVWFTNRYSHGRLGAFFRDGFNCPLLTQISTEIPQRLPRLIGEKHRLLQLWAFKYNSFQPNTPAHADFAAVNINFWITPTSANQDRNSGGMVVYDVEAPLDWDFDSYNKQGAKIGSFLAARGARGTVIPYRCNRAVIFNSDLFHATAPINFRRGYENRRINVTLLYGKRESAANTR